MAPLRARAWWFPVAFSVHNLEEALWLPAWSRDAAPFHAPVSAFEMAFAVTVLSALSVVVTALGRSRGNMFGHATVGSWVMMLGNVVAPHLAATVALGRYAPGLGTGLLVMGPVAGWLLVSEVRRGSLGLGRALANGLVVSALTIGSLPALFLLGRQLEHFVH